jgi:hypothetical protein
MREHKLGCKARRALPPAPRKGRAFAIHPSGLGAYPHTQLE